VKMTELSNKKILVQSCMCRKNTIPDDNKGELHVQNNKL
jgi:hypothetical protein